MAPAAQFVPGTPVTLVARIRAAWSLRDNARTLVEHAPGTFHPIVGLRALSILWVMAYHVALVMPGHKGIPDGLVMRLLRHGFFGVDVFFVISGFLITDLLLRDHQRSGRIRFRPVLCAPCATHPAGLLRLARAFCVALAARDLDDLGERPLCEQLRSA